jgi:hopanoid biosynthesis associated RND transporter like protein HpnN
MKSGRIPNASSSHTFYGRVAKFSFINAGSVIALYLFLAICSLLFAYNYLAFDTDPGKMISADLPFRRDFVAFQQAFPIFDNTFLVVVEADHLPDAKRVGRTLVQSFRKKQTFFKDIYAPGLGAFFERNGFLYLPLEQLRAIIKKILKFQPLISTIARQPNITGLTNLISSAAADRTAVTPEELIGLVNLTDKTMRAWMNNKSLPLNWPELIDNSTSRHKGGRFYITVKPVMDFTLLDPAAAPLAEANRIIKELKAAENGKVNIYLTGEAALNSQELGTVMHGTVRAGIVSLILVGMIIWLGMPLTRLVIPVLSLLLLGFLLNVGFAAITIGSLNMISIVFVVLFIGLGVDYAVHIILRYWENLVAGQGRLPAVISATRDTGPALALCTFTTSFSFLAFSFTDFIGMAQLGIIAAGGITVAFAASITLIPAVLALIPIPEKLLTAKTKNYTALLRMLPTWSNIRFFLTTVTLCGGFAALFVLPDVHFDGDPIHLKDQSSSTVTSYKKVVADTPGEVYAAQVISPDAYTAKAMAMRLEKLNVVHSVRWFNSFVPNRQQEKLRHLHKLKGNLSQFVSFPNNILDETRRVALVEFQENLGHMKQAFQGLDAFQEAVDKLHSTVTQINRKVGSGAALSSLEHDLFSKLPVLLYQLGVMSNAVPISSQNMDQDIPRRYINDNNLWRLEVIPKREIMKEGQLLDFVSRVRAIAPHATGAPVEIIGAAGVVSSAMGKATVIAMFFVLTILVPVFRSVKEILLVLLPLVLAGLLLLACTVLFNVPFNFANVIVLPLLLGLGIDSAIHYVLRARENHEAGDIMATTTPRAIILSSLTTIGSFGTLWLSAHKGISSMGELLVISLGITLWCTLIVLPQLVAWSRRQWRPVTSSPDDKTTPRRGR